MGNCNLSFLLKVGLALCIGMILHRSVSAQCSSGFSTHTYDTTLSSNGFGMYTISVPQWSPDSGTLVSVKLSSSVSSQYGFTLRNADNANATYTLTLGQDDQITGSVLSSPFTNVMSQLVNTYPLTPGQQVTQDPFVFLDNHISSDSITNVAPFLGMGQVTLNYLSFTYTNLSTVNNATYYYSANVNNNIHFSVTYTFCTGGNVILAANLTRFSAVLSAPHAAQLSWAAVNETANRAYDVQRSTDGKTFETISTVAAQGNESGADYTYTDNLADTLSGDILYRLQIHDQDKLSWSPVQQVDVAAAATTAAASPGFRIFPNPATHYINVTTGQENNDWQVEIFAANGTLVQKESFMKSATFYIPFRVQLAAGTYFVKLTGLAGQQGAVGSFIVTPGN